MLAKSPPEAENTYVSQALLPLCLICLACCQGVATDSLRLAQEMKRQKTKEGAMRHKIASILADHIHKSLHVSPCDRKARRLTSKMCDGRTATCRCAWTTRCVATVRS